MNERKREMIEEQDVCVCVCVCVCVTEEAGKKKGRQTDR